MHDISLQFRIQLQDKGRNMEVRGAARIREARRNTAIRDMVTHGHGLRNTKEWIRTENGGFNPPLLPWLHKDPINWQYRTLLDNRAQTSGCRAAGR